MLAQDLIHIPSLSRAAEGVVAQADGHPALPRFAKEPAEQIPPFFAEQRRLARFMSGRTRTHRCRVCA